MNALDNYLNTAPTAQNSIDIFKGTWTSCFPPSMQVQAGPLHLFEDHRIDWFVQEIGGVHGWRILELGPLEGAHSAMLEWHGVREVVAVEANQAAYLRCLITKEILNLTKCRFLLGDINAYMESTADKFDFCLASGVLYHMTDPVHTLELISQKAGKIFLWTHYYEQSVCGPQSRFASVPDTYHWHGIDIPMYRHTYGSELSMNSFCGGSTPQVMWLEKSSIKRVLQELGFHDIREMGNTLTHPSGPAVSLLALK